MRRLWAYVIIAFTALVAVFASMPSLIKGISSNGDHSVRRQFTFQLVEKEAENPEEEVAKLNENSAKEMAKIMEQRLISYGVESYDISVSGDNEISDIITVSFKADDNTQYQQIVSYLTFSGSFALMNNQNDVVEDNQFRNGNAYLKEVSVNEYPTVILPIKNSFTEWETLITGAKDNPVTEGEGEESSTVARLWLIYNYRIGDNYQILEETNELTNKTLLTFDFDPENEEELYYDSNKNSLSRICGYQDTNSNGVADANEVKAAYNQADYLLHLFNSSSLDFEVRCVKGLIDGTQVWVQPKVETVIKEGTIVWNNTLSAALAAVIIASLLLVVFYRLGAVGVASATVLSVFAGFLFMILAGLEYSVLAVAALVAIGVVSLASGVVYLNKLKEDAYRGHTLKKANTEASKKSLLPIIDIHIVSVIIGLMCYLLGGTALHSFGAILTFGSIISFIINTLGLKGMMWLATNTTGLIGKYEAFGINSENVPNHMAEEKQRFYGPYAEKDFTVKKKPISIIALSAFVLSLVGVIVSSSLNGGNVFKNARAQVTGGEIYVVNKIKVEDDDSKSKLDKNSLEEKILSYIEIEDSANTYKPLSDFVASTNYDNFTFTQSKTVEGVTSYYLTTYYVVKLKKVISLDINAKFADEAAASATTLSAKLDELETDPTLFSGSESNSISIKTIETYVPVASPNWGKIALATTISILILTLYLTLRYRLSRGLATIVMPFAATGITVGLITLLNVIGMQFTNIALVAVPFVALFTYLFMISFMNRERELVIDDKSRDASVEHRVELSKKALGMAAAQMFATAGVCIYLLVDFFGFGVATSSMLYLVAILGSIISLGLVVTLFVPLSNILFSLFSKITINRKPRERKNKKTAPKKSAEPEEAIFIGIND